MAYINGKKVLSVFKAIFAGKYTLKEIWSGNGSLAVHYDWMSETPSNSLLLVTMSSTIPDLDYTPTIKIPIFITNTTDNNSNSGVWVYSTPNNKWIHAFVFSNNNELSGRYVLNNSGSWGTIQDFSIKKVEIIEIKG